MLAQLYRKGWRIGNLLEPMPEALLGLIEEIRYKRQDEWRDRPHPLGRRFTQLELTQEALPTYGNLLAGRSKRLPARRQILDVAEYLECTIVETNDLLIAAQYLPERRELSRSEYDRLHKRASWLSSIIPLPSLVVKPNLEVIYANRSILEINGIPDMNQLSAQELMGVHWYLNPRMPSYPWYNANIAATKANARGIAELLWLVGGPCLHEPYMKAALKDYMQFPDFQAYWQQICTTGLSSDEGESHADALMQTRFLEQPIEEGSVLIPLDQDTNLTLLISIPKSDAARHVYRHVGCEIDNIRLDELIGDLGAYNG